jgi:hypothetical protein
MGKREMTDDKWQMTKFLSKAQQSQEKSHAKPQRRKGKNGRLDKGLQRDG